MPTSFTARTEPSATSHTVRTENEILGGVTMESTAFTMEDTRITMEGAGVVTPFTVRTEPSATGYTVRTEP